LQHKPFIKPFGDNNRCVSLFKFIELKIIKHIWFDADCVIGSVKSKALSLNLGYFIILHNGIKTNIVAWQKRYNKNY
jgi:hypothetical protein